jgi:hypothetical protein
MLTNSLRAGTVLLIALGACAPTPAPEPPLGDQVAIDTQQLITDIRVLAADTMEGRATGTPGSERAQRYLLRRFAEIGLTPFGAGYEQPFDFVPRGGTEQQRGVNIVGFIPGTDHPDHYIVVTAHYDHLGIRDGRIYHGADDNASGTAALLALARHFRELPPRHSMIFAALDAEEVGLRGARAFVATPPVPQQAILFNINMDMVSRSEADELFAVGTFHHPWLLPHIEHHAAGAPLTLRTGHDRPDLPPGEDWTMSSDHGAFHEEGIPFLYFGVEDHPDYHQPTDVFGNIDPDFFARAVETVRRVARALDADHTLLRANR